MQRVEEPMETIHLYVVREEEPPPSLLPFVCAVLFLLCTIAAGIAFPYRPAYEHKTLNLPAQFFSRTFSATAPVIPTGIRTYPATQAHGVLTIYNGSILQQEIPAGMIFTTNSIEIVADTTAVVPAGNPPYYGIATISAHAVIAGARGNIPAYAINQVYGASIYIRNLHAFTGGKDSHSVSVVTAQDKQTARDTAQSIVASQEARTRAILAKPCNESTSQRKAILELFWTCQYVTFTIPAYMGVTHVGLFGSRVLVDVVFVARPERIETK